MEEKKEERSIVQYLLYTRLTTKHVLTRSKATTLHSPQFRKEKNDNNSREEEKGEEVEVLKYLKERKN